MNQVKTTQTQAQQAQAKSSEHFKLFRREVIWIQCFHWPNITTCGKYPGACVISCTCCTENASISASTRKRRILILVLALALRGRDGMVREYFLSAPPPPPPHSIPFHSPNELQILNTSAKQGRSEVTCFQRERNTKTTDNNNKTR